MERTEYTESDRNEITVYKEAIYISENIGDNRTFQGIVNKYKNYRFTEHLDSIREEFECQSYSHIIFSIQFEINEKIRFFLLFSSILEIPNREEMEYNISNLFDETERDETTVNNLLRNNLYDRVYIKAEMDTKFYIHRGLDIINQYDDEIEDSFEDDDPIPAIVEIPFVTEQCSVCLDNSPNILLLPCLHLSVCSQCEDIGKLIKCPTCRKIILRKVKI